MRYAKFDLTTGSGERGLESLLAKLSPDQLHSVTTTSFVMGDGADQYATLFVVVVWEDA